ncbi:hypothetical protein, partial [Burkholderia gladioli]|uniref:hypothetical protein n=1 Tax=Burkholderia gladioli TaxID=28095 RepID=UPI0034DB2CF5
RTGETVFDRLKHPVAHHVTGVTAGGHLALAGDFRATSKYRWLASGSRRSATLGQLVRSTVLTIRAPTAKYLGQRTADG